MHRVTLNQQFRAALRRLGWTVHRWPAHRFDAMDDALRLLRLRGYRPQVVVDIGANRGTWTELAMEVFDAREYHLVEPSPACRSALDRLMAPGVHVHPVALTRGGQPVVHLVDASGSTGAWIAESATGSGGAAVPATTLDGLLAGRVRRDDRPLLKLDVETHELVVLADGTRVLAASEVVIVEFRLFAVDGAPQPVFADVMEFMQARGFELHDFAALGSRRRDQRLAVGDAIFVRADSALALDVGAG